MSACTRADDCEALGEGARCDLARGRCLPREEPDAGVTPCAAHADCDDRLFCNGNEQCRPGEPGADARGCLGGIPPCAAGEGCAEPHDRCLPMGCEEPDGDGDGHARPVCGGDDCDDDDANRFPGKAEVCDTNGHDEDCEPSTFGFRDLDDDGFVDARCCNPTADGGTLCGADCDDMRRGDNPNSPEVCDGFDNDCDGLVDEGVTRTLYRDADGDGYGDPTLPTRADCGTSTDGVENAFDCDDADPDVRPGAAEQCDGVDNNCDGLFERDADGDAHLDPSSVCAGGALPLDDCNDFDARVFPGAPELCDDRDNDCDGLADERADADLACAALDGVTAAYCLDRRCEIAACDAARGDCNGRRTDGCEADLMVDRDHCGGCGLRCPLGEACTDGMCAVPSVVAIGAGQAHSCAVTALGHVGCWGANDRGQLGDRTTVSRSHVVRASGVVGAVEVAAGDRHTCAALSDGRVVCWGEGDGGQLGDGRQEGSLSPLTVSASTSLAGLDAGLSQTCAMDDAGGSWCWGAALGFAPEPASTASPFDLARAIATSGRHRCALLADGTAQCFGFASWGQLGDGGTADEYCSFDGGAGSALCSTAPLDVVGLSGLSSIAVGTEHSCASDGATVWCWGYNSHGQVGDGTAEWTDTPTTALTMSGGDSVRSVRAGGHGSCALTADGDLVCWGSDLAVSSTAGPVVVATGGPVSEAAVGGYAGGTHACFVHSQTAYCFGANYDGQLGDRTRTSRAAPARVAGFDPATTVRMGEQAACARMGSGELLCWGDGDPVPARVAGVDMALDVAVGQSHRCLLNGAGAVSCWGENDRGQLGLGDTTPRTSPAAVGLPPARALDAIGSRTCAVLRDGRVMCWGDGAYGARGDGTTGDAASPTEVIGVSDAVAVSMGSRHTCVLRRKGSVSCWGYGGLGALGDGRSLSSTTPVDVEGVDDAIAITAGGEHTCTVRIDGSVQCFGAGADGQLGAGPLVGSSAVPVEVRGLVDVTHVTAGRAHTCARERDGDVWCWGSNDIGQLARPDAQDTPAGPRSSDVPLQVDGLVALTVTARGNTSCAIAAGRGVRCWGSNVEGQVGYGEINCRATLVFGFDPAWNCEAEVPRLVLDT